MKGSWKLILLVLAILVVVWWYRGGSEAPEEKLARHFDEVCNIASDHIDRPEAGVEALFAYLGDQGPRMLKQFGATLVAIERTPGDDAHDARARLARERMWQPLRQCSPVLERFFAAVEGNPAARDRLERGLERFSRTLEILFGAGGAGVLEDWLPPSRFNR